MFLNHVKQDMEQGDPESPVLFSDFIQDLIDSLESKINLWYLDDGNLSDAYRTVLEDLKNIVEAEKTPGLKIRPTKCEIFFLTSLKNDDLSFQKLAPRSKHQKKMKLSFLVHRSARIHKQTYWKRKILNWKKLVELLKNYMRTMVFFHVEKLLQSAKVVVPPENQYMI